MKKYGEMLSISVVQVTLLSAATWLLGLLGFPALVLVWHWWRIQRNPGRFADTSPLSFVLRVALPGAVPYVRYHALLTKSA